MTGESRGLGRGLAALLSAQPRAGVSPLVTNTLPLASIQQGPSQPRKTIAPQPLEELAASIKANGVIQPIVVRPVAHVPGAKPRYEIVAGERRWQAAQLAGLEEIPVVIREFSDQEAIAIALIENIQREELTPTDEARALQRLIGEFSLTHQEAADAVGRSRAAVSNLLRLLDLPDAVVALIDAKSLSMGHARALLGLEDDAERLRIARLVAERGWSVRETENLVRKASRGAGKAGPPATAPQLSVVSELLKTHSARVQLHQDTSGAGKLIVQFADAVTRDRACRALKQALEE